MSYIALVRMQNGSLVAIKREEDVLAEWETEHEAEAAMENHILAPLGVEIVEVDS